MKQQGPMDGKRLLLLIMIGVTATLLPQTLMATGGIGEPCHPDNTCDGWFCDPRYNRCVNCGVNGTPCCDDNWCGWTNEPWNFGCDTAFFPPMCMNTDMDYCGHVGHPQCDYAPGICYSGAPSGGWCFNAGDYYQPCYTNVYPAQECDYGTCVNGICVPVSTTPGGPAGTTGGHSHTDEDAKGGLACFIRTLCSRFFPR